MTKNFKFTPQLDLMGCGVACLSMISKYFVGGILKSGEKQFRRFSIRYCFTACVCVKFALGVNDVLLIDKTYIHLQNP